MEWDLGWRRSRVLAPHPNMERLSPHMEWDLGWRRSRVLAPQPNMERAATGNVSSAKGRTRREKASRLLEKRRAEHSVHATILSRASSA